VDDCGLAVHILSKESADGGRHNNDAAYALAAQLLAALANIGAGADPGSASVADAIADAKMLLGTGGTLSDGTNVSTDAANFNDMGDYWRGGKDASQLGQLALELAAILDDYNNGLNP
jgi:hypothetical protein